MPKKGLKVGDTVHRVGQPLRVGTIKQITMKPGSRGTEPQSCTVSVPYRGSHRDETWTYNRCVLAD